jgi:hypothetical protein
VLTFLSFVQKVPPEPTTPPPPPTSSNVDPTEALKAAINALSSNGETWRFLYCPADENNTPLMIVEPEKVNPRRLLSLMRTAKSRDFVTGTMLFKDGKPLLKANRPDHPQFRPHLREVFGVSVPALANAAVISDSESELDAPTSPLSTAPVAPVKATVTAEQPKSPQLTAKTPAQSAQSSSKTLVKSTGKITLDLKLDDDFDFEGSDPKKDIRGKGNQGKGKSGSDRDLSAHNLDDDEADNGSGVDKGDDDDDDGSGGSGDGDDEEAKTHTLLVRCSFFFFFSQLARTILTLFCLVPSCNSRICSCWIG